MHYSPPLMHIPDGFLSGLVALVLWLISAVVVGYALRKVNPDLGEREVPTMGVLAAALFAAQMLNFPVAGGTSGHLIGAALATILLGPWAAIIIMTCVVSIQALIFQDGGLLALGGNIFNMAIAATAVAYFAYQTIRRVGGGRSGGLYVGGFAAAWLSVVVAAIVTAFELALSGTAPVEIALPAMSAVHMLIGIGEGLITVGALAFLYSTRRDLVTHEESKPVSRTVWGLGLIIALALAVLAPLASTFPDGLEWVAAQNGFLNRVQNAPYRIIPNYTLPGIASPALATILAGMIGTFLVFGAALAVAYLRRNRRAALP